MINFSGNRTLSVRPVFVVPGTRNFAGHSVALLKVSVEDYQMTDRGHWKLGSGSLDSGGSKTPGAALGVVGAIATANPAGGQNN